jgi:dihydrofolate reductase
MAAVRATVFVGVSLDGLIARPDGGIDWLVGGNAGGEDYGFKAFMDTVDVLVMGRHTYEKVETFEAWPYGDKPVVVLSHHPVAIPDRLRATVETMAGAPAEVVARLAQRGASHLYVDGGKTIQAFLDAGLIDRLVITRVPVLIGSGIPLFGPVARDITLRHVATRAYATGLVQSEYQVIR